MKVRLKQDLNPLIDKNGGGKITRKEWVDSAYGSCASDDAKGDTESRYLL